MPHHRGLARVGWVFTLTATAYKLVRLPKLVGNNARNLPRHGKKSKIGTRTCATKATTAGVVTGLLFHFSKTWSFSVTPPGPARNLPLPETPEGAMLAARPAGIWGMSVYTCSS